MYPDKKLQNFLVLNGRLPCVDTDLDGVEDCGSGNVKGALPYITLGMKNPGFKAGDTSILYGVYRNANTNPVANNGIDHATPTSVLSNDADLTASVNRYQPMIPSDPVGDSFDFSDAEGNHINGLDFCQALNNAQSTTSTTVDTSKLFVQTSSGSQKNVAYALAIGGSVDGDNDNQLFDSLNASTQAAFNSSGTFLSSFYDDAVLSRSFSELQNTMQCDVLLGSVNLVSISALSQLQVQKQADALAQYTETGAIVAGVTALVTTVLTVKAAAALAGGTANIATSASLLSSAIASCAVIVGCAFIPVYTAALAVAGVGTPLCQDSCPVFIS
jgi:hypothetical protein